MLVPVLDQVDAGDDLDHLAVGDRQHAGVAGQQQPIRLIQVYRDIELRQGPSHYIADPDLGRITVVVQDNFGMLRQLGVISDDELADVGTPTVATPAP